MKCGKVTFAMAARCTVARIIALGGVFVENEHGTLQVSLPEGCDAVSIRRIIDTTLDGNPAYRTAVTKAARKKLNSASRNDKGAA